MMIKVASGRLCNPLAIASDTLVHDLHLVDVGPGEGEAVELAPVGGADLERACPVLRVVGVRAPAEVVVAGHDVLVADLAGELVGGGVQEVACSSEDAAT